jgi:hypothetical protein
MVGLGDILPRRTELTPRRHLANLLTTILALHLALDNLLLLEGLEHYAFNFMDTCKKRGEGRVC